MKTTILIALYLSVIIFCTFSVELTVKTTHGTEIYYGFPFVWGGMNGAGSSELFLSPIRISINFLILMLANVIIGHLFRKVYINFSHRLGLEKILKIASIILAISYFLYLGLVFHSASLWKIPVENEQKFSIKSRSIVFSIPIKNNF